MTKEEIVKILNTWDTEYGGIESGYRFEEIANDILALQPQWIPVNERLPEESWFYIVYTSLADTRVASYSIYTKEWTLENVTHWMLLPKPPKEENND